MTAQPGSLDELDRMIRDLALALPGAWEDHPWGDTVFKAGAKVFAFYGLADERINLGVKVPQSFETALAMPGARPTPYGLGRHGWVSLQVRVGTEPKLDLVEAWLEESFRATAPKRLVGQLDGRRGDGPRP